MTIEQVPCSVSSLTGWGLVRERLDLKRVDLLDEDGNLADTDEKLNQALSVALIEEDESEEIEDEEVEDALTDTDEKLNQALSVALIEEDESEEIEDEEVEDAEEDQVNVQESMVDWSLFQVSYKVCTSCAHLFVRYLCMCI